MAVLDSRLTRSSKLAASTTAAWLVLAAIVLLAGLARFFWIDHQSLWGDEGYTWQHIRGSLPQLIAGIRAEGSQVPLYFIGQWVWRHFFGTSELGLRSFSAVAGIVGVVFVWLAADRLLNRRAALIAAMLAAVSPVWVYYSQEARPYALSATFAAGIIACALRAVSNDRIRWGWLAGYVVCTAGAALTHYFAILPALAALLILPRNRAGIGLWLGSTALAAIPLLIWIAAGWTTFASTISSGGPRGLPIPAYLGGVFEAFAVGLPSPTGLPAAVLALGVVVALVGLRSPGGALLAVWLIAVLGGAEIIGFPSDRPGPWIRYVIAALPAFVLLEAAGIERLARLRPVLGLIAFVALLGVSLVSLGHVYFDPALARFDFRTPVRQLAASVTPEDRVIVNQGSPAFFYYYGDTQPAPIMLVPGPTLQPGAQLEQALADAVAGSRHVYLMKYMPPDYDPNNQIETWLDSHGVKVGDQWIEHTRLITYDFAPAAGLDDPATHRLSARLGDAIELLGWSVPADTRAGVPSRVTLFWRTTKPLTTDLKVFVHVLPPSDLEQKVAQHDSLPALGAAPPTRWQPGAVVVDAHPLTFPAGEWLLAVGMYDPVSGDRPTVRVDGKPDDSRLLLGPITVR